MTRGPSAAWNGPADPGRRKRTMQHLEVRTLEDAGRASAVWSGEHIEHQPRFAEVAVALLPASLILATATALLVALL